VGDSVLSAERGEKLSCGRYNVVLREGRSRAVGDTVLCAERGEKLSGGLTVLCADRGEKLSGGRYSVLW